MSQAVQEFDILFVDDEKAILDLGEEVLEGDGMNVDTTTDPEEAYEMFQEKEYDAIISDYDMGRVDGEDLLQEVREKDKEIPFFFHTGRRIEELAVGEFNEYITEYQAKEGGLEAYRELASRIIDCSEN